MIARGALLTLEIERPASGGRMIARHEGQIVLVGGGIPGERVTARVERVSKGVAQAETVDVISASPDRRPVAYDPRCGGNLFAHIAYPRQLSIKGEIIADAFRRIGRLPLPSPVRVIGSPEDGYRLRARLHAEGGRFGFFLEGTHRLCQASPSGQLSTAASAWIAAAEAVVAREGIAGISGLEIVENVAGDQRACHIELQPGTATRGLAALADGLVGLSAQHDGSDVVRVIAGTPALVETIAVRRGEATGVLRLRRDVRAFFQGNRFLLETLVAHVLAGVTTASVIDLYAGVGLFGLAWCASGGGVATLVEGDPISAADLTVNAQMSDGRAHVERRSVEAFFETRRARTHGDETTVIVDPPRTGMSPQACRGVVGLGARRIIYVSCDVATMARDARVLVEAGYQLGEVVGMDLFPNTAHVEAVAIFDASHPISL